MAASSSTMFLKITSTLGGRKSCVRKIAMETPKNPPRSSASTELYMVPQIAGSTPKRLWLTSQVVEVMKLRPYFCMAGAALRPTCPRRYSTNTIVSTANTNVRPRSDRSKNRSSLDGGVEIDSLAVISSVNSVDFMRCRFQKEIHTDRLPGRQLSMGEACQRQSVVRPSARYCPSARY